MRKEIVLAAVGVGVMVTARLQAPPMPIAGPTSGSRNIPTMPGGACLPLDCSDVTVAPPGGFTWPDAAGFVPDRRPSVNIATWTGFCSSPPTGNPAWWTDLNDLDVNGIVDGVDELLVRLDQEYANGWRRMILMLPAGAYPGIMASSQWWTMPAARRDSITTALPMWLAAHPDATVGLYVGYEIGDPCALCMHGCLGCFCDAGGGPCDLCPECAGFPPAVAPISTSAQDMCVVYQNVEPWIDAGIYEIWFDHAGGPDPDHWGTLLELAGNPDYTGRIRFGGEPIVIDGVGGGANEPVLDVVQRMTFVSLRRYYEIFGGNAPMEAWTFDPATTEVHAIFRNDSFCLDQVSGDGNPCSGCPDWCEGVPDAGAAIDVVYDFLQRGYVVHARGNLPAEYLRRILDQEVATLPCVSDLDADGDVDGADADRLASHIGMTTGATLYHGDVDFDDDVDIIDYFLLVAHPGFPGPCD